MATRSVGESSEQINPASVNYRPGDVMSNCGKCMHFDGPSSWCRALNIAVNETDVCDLFADLNATAPAGGDLMSQLFGM